MTGLPLYLLLKETFLHRKLKVTNKLKLRFSTNKEIENVGHDALKVEQIVEKCWCNESAATINLRCKEIFTRRIPRKLKDFAQNCKSNILVLLFLGRSFAFGTFHSTSDACSTC